MKTEEKDGMYYLVDPGYRALKYEVKDGKIGKIWIYTENGRLDGGYGRNRKLEILENMKKDEMYSDSIMECRYEDEEGFKKVIEGWKRME